MPTTEYTHRERTARVPMAVALTRPPGRGRTWSAESGHWRAEGPTEKVATDRLTGGLRVFLDRYRPPSVLTFRGHVAVVSLELGDVGNDTLGWRLRIVHPDGHTSESIESADGWDEFEARARYRLADLSTDWHSDDSVRDGAAYLVGGQRYGYGQYGPEELYRYAEWQRAAKAAMDAGRDDWHQWAGDNARDYAIARPTN